MAGRRTSPSPFGTASNSGIEPDALSPSLHAQYSALRSIYGSPSPPPVYTVPPHHAPPPPSSSPRPVLTMTAPLPSVHRGGAFSKKPQGTTAPPPTLAGTWSPSSAQQRGRAGPAARRGGEESYETAHLVTISFDGSLRQQGATARGMGGRGAAGLGRGHSIGTGTGRALTTTSTTGGRSMGTMTLRQQREAARLREIQAQQEEKLRRAKEWLLQRRASSISAGVTSPSPTTGDALPALPSRAATSVAAGVGGVERKEGGTQAEAGTEAAARETRSQGTQVDAVDVVLLPAPAPPADPGSATEPAPFDTVEIAAPVVEAAAVVAEAEQEQHPAPTPTPTPTLVEEAEHQKAVAVEAPIETATITTTDEPAASPSPSAAPSAAVEEAVPVAGPEVTEQPEQEREQAADMVVKEEDVELSVPEAPTAVMEGVKQEQEGEAAPAPEASQQEEEAPAAEVPVIATTSNEEEEPLARPAPVQPAADNEERVVEIEGQQEGPAEEEEGEAAPTPDVPAVLVLPDTPTPEQQQEQNIVAPAPAPEAAEPTTEQQPTAAEESQAHEPVTEPLPAAEEGEQHKGAEGGWVVVTPVAVGPVEEEEAEPAAEVAAPSETMAAADKSPVEEQPEPYQPPGEPEAKPILEAAPVPVEEETECPAVEPQEQTQEQDEEAAPVRQVSLEERLAARALARQLLDEVEEGVVSELAAGAELEPEPAVVMTVVEEERETVAAVLTKMLERVAGAHEAQEGQEL